MSSRKRKARDDEPGSRSEDEERDVIAGVEHAEGDSDDDQRDEREGCSGESDDSDEMSDFSGRSMSGCKAF